MNSQLYQMVGELFTLGMIDRAERKSSLLPTLSNSREATIGITSPTWAITEVQTVDRLLHG